METFTCINIPYRPEICKCNKESRSAPLSYSARSSILCKAIYKNIILKVSLHGPSMFAVKAKIYGVLYNQASSIAFDEPSSYWSALCSAHDFSAFHWSPRGNLVSICHHFVITRVVHLPKRTETSLITESDRFGPIR